MPSFTQEQLDEAGGHTFGVYLCEGNPELVADLAALVRELYVSEANTELAETLEGALEDLDQVIDTAFIGGLIDQLAEAAIPKPGPAPGQPPQLDIARNELAEVIAYEVVEQIHGADIPAKRIREKESVLPSRGLDLLATIGNDSDLVLLVTEVKASSEGSSPPGVVGDGDNCLDAQTRAFLSDEKKLLAELLWAHKHTSEDGREVVAKAMVLLGMKTLQVRAAPVLLRPRTALGDDDFGCFRADPGTYEPANVSFVVVVIEESLEELSRAVYEKAREAAA